MSRSSNPKYFICIQSRWNCSLLRHPQCHCCPRNLLYGGCLWNRQEQCRCGFEGGDKAGACNEVDCSYCYDWCAGIITRIYPKAKSYYLFDGYAHLSSGFTCGITGLSGGMAIGIVAGTELFRIPNVQIMVTGLKKLMCYTKWYRSWNNNRLNILSHGGHPILKLEILSLLLMVCYFARWYQEFTVSSTTE